MQLEPGEYFGIVRQLADPSDAGTYYVRAVIRNARTDATIDTVNLAVKSNQRYQAEWRVYAQSADPLYISITTYVYTDSGFTTLSDAYGAETNTYLIESRAKHVGGGMGSSVNYKRIEEIITNRKSVQTIDIEELIREMHKMHIEHFKQVSNFMQNRIDELRSEIKAHIVDNKTSINFEPIMKEIRNMDFSPKISISNEVDTKDVVDAVMKAMDKDERKIAENISIHARSIMSQAMTWMGKSMELAGSKHEMLVRSPFEGMTIREQIKFAISKKYEK